MRHLLRSVIFIFIVFSTTLFAGTLTNMSVSQTNSETTATSTYTFTFRTATAINSGNWSDGAYFFLDLDNDYTVNGASLVSISPSISGMNINSRNDSTAKINMYTGSGSIQANTTYTVVISGIQNPSVAQTPDAHYIRTGDGDGTIDSGYVSANAITAAASNPPVVQSQIADKSSLLESDGIITYVANLDSHFLDSDGDAITYSVLSSDSSVVAVALTGAGNDALTLQAKKYGTATITVTATTSDGSVSDTFNVTAIGQMAVNSSSSSTNVAGADSTFTFNITLESNVVPGDAAYFWFDFPNDYGVDSGSVITSVSPSFSYTSRYNSGSSVVYLTANSTIPAGTYTVTMSGVANPASAGSYGSVSIDTRDGSGTTYDKGSVALATITAAQAPTVIEQLSDLSSVKEAQGIIEIVSDLNDNFSDADGDTITFTVSSSDTSTVVATTSGTNGKVLSIEAKKYGTADITVTATTSDGSVSDTFSVSTIGALTFNSISSSTDVASYATTLSMSVTLESAVSDSGGDGAYLYFKLPSAYDVNNSSVITLTSPSVSGTTHVNTSSKHIWFIADASTISAGTYQVAISNVTNPSTGGSFGVISLDTRDGGSTIFDEGNITLPSIAAGSTPTISSAISDQLAMKESDGQQTIIADLNNHFSDGNGDTLTFSVSANSDPSVATVSLSGSDNRTLSILPLRAGSTTVSITANDNVHGTISDSFVVTTIGLLPSASMTFSSLEADAIGDINVTFVNESTVPYQGTVVLDFDDGYTVSDATLESVDAGGATLAIASRDNANAKITLVVTSGTIVASTTVSFNLKTVTNPATIATTANAIIQTSDGNDVIDEREVDGVDIVKSSDTVMVPLYYLLF